LVTWGFFRVLGAFSVGLSAVGRGLGRLRRPFLRIVVRVRVRWGGGEHEVDGGVGTAPLGEGQDACVGVGVGVTTILEWPEQVLQGSQVGAGLVSERCGAVAHVVQPDRWDATVAYQRRNRPLA
jgi:hypothetical protein